MSRINTSHLDAIYSFTQKVYRGNGQLRFGDTPYMEAAIKNGQTESVLGHELACMALWFLYRRCCPNLDRLIDSIRLYEIFLNHDLGETGTGDVSNNAQLGGRGVNKVFDELEEINRMGTGLPAATLGDLTSHFSAFENKQENADLEIMLARFIDNLEGNLFVLTYGTDLPTHAETINKILNRKFIPYAHQLLKRLQQLDEKGALEEVKQITSYHLAKFKEACVTISVNEEFSDLIPS